MADKTGIAPLNVLKIFNKVTGLMTEDRAALFVVNVLNKLQPGYYEKLYGLKSADAFLGALRYMIQEYVMGGI